MLRNKRLLLFLSTVLLRGSKVEESSFLFLCFQGFVYSHTIYNQFKINTLQSVKSEKNATAVLSLSQSVEEE